MAKCGNCLMEAVEVVQVLENGQCPRCGQNYDAGVPPEPEARIRKYRLYFVGRVKRAAAVGSMQNFTAERSSYHEEGAWLQLYEHYQDIRREHAEEVMP